MGIAKILEGDVLLARCRLEGNVQQRCRWLEEARDIYENLLPIYEKLESLDMWAVAKGRTRRYCRS